MKFLALLHSDPLSRECQNMKELTELAGVETRLFDTSANAFPPNRLAELQEQCGGIALSAATFLSLLYAPHLQNQDSSAAALPAGNWLIWGWGQGDLPTESRALSELTKGVVRRITEFRDSRSLRFPATGREFSGPLAGCEFTKGRVCKSSTFEVGHELQSIMLRDDAPAFVRMEREQGSLFLWAAGGDIPGAGTRIPEEEFAGECDSFVPLLVFLRKCFPSECWTNPVKTARLIIDDPLLRRSYGFLNYEELMREVAGTKFGMTTAFIPWNSGRTRRADARFFEQFGERHSPCIHGCDHNNNEFGTEDSGILSSKAFDAIHRMEQHQKQTGLAHDRVMVFPQGRFSAASMLALRNAGFLAAVNTSRLPSESALKGLTLADELTPATNCYSGLALFGRRYPKRLSECALDLFLGKPAHIVEHHEWFKAGVQEAVQAIRWLNGVAPELTWPSLTVALRRQHQMRVSARGPEVRFFTSEFEFSNPSEVRQSFIFTRPDPLPKLVSEVVVNGSTVPFETGADGIQFRFELEGKQSLSVRLKSGSTVSELSWRPGFSYKLKVSVRRRLSELRDNHLARHPGVFQAAKSIVRKLKMSGDSVRSEKR